VWKTSQDKERTSSSHPETERDQREDERMMKDLQTITKTAFSSPSSLPLEPPMTCSSSPNSSERTMSDDTEGQISASETTERVKEMIHSPYSSPSPSPNVSQVQENVSLVSFQQITSSTTLDSVSQQTTVLPQPLKECKDAAEREEDDEGDEDDEEEEEEPRL